MADTATITVLITDLVDSTRLLQHGPEVADELRRAHFAAVRDAISRHRGVEVKSTGDGIMCTFASAADALDAAEAIQQAAEQLRRADSRQPAVRVALSTGEASFEDGDWYGPPVIEAARLVAPDQAGGGDVLATAVVPAVTGRRGAHTFTPLGERVLKGFDAPVQVVRLEWRPFRPAEVPLPGGVSLNRGAFFVGRVQETERLDAAWQRAKAGERLVVMVAGEPGIGKTRLCAELARRAHASGALVLWGHCDEELAAPFQPFVEALRGWLDHDPNDLTSRADADLARLLPEIGPRPTEADPESERLLGFRSVARLLAGRSVSTPILLVLDDLHWAAAPTLLMLRHLARDAAPASLLIAGTYRDTELARTHPLADLLADLRRDGDIERVTLRGLDRDAVVAYVEAAAGESIGEQGEALAGLVHAGTEGNPFFIGQLLRHLTESGQLTRAGGRWTATRSLDQLGLPEGIREVIGRRLSRLPEGADRALGVAAVLGAEFDLALLERIEDAGTPADILNFLDAAVGARLLDESPGRPGRFVFGHALVRQTLLSELTAARCARLHRRAADALAAEPEPDAVALANHYCGGATAGAIDEAIEWSMRAASLLSRRLAFEECAMVLERALQVLELATVPAVGIRARIKLGLAQAVAAYGPTDIVKRWAADAADDARRAGDIVLLADAARLRVSWGLQGIPDPLGRALIEEALAGLGDHQVALRAQMQALLGFYRAVNESEGVAAEPLMRSALDLARAAGDDELLAFALANLMVTLVSLPNLDEVEALSAEFDAVQGRLSEPARRGPIASFQRRSSTARERVVVRLQRGDLHGSRTACHEAEVAQRERAELGSEFRSPFVSMWRGMYALLEGALDEAEAANTALATDAQGDPNFLNSWGAQLFMIRREQGRVAELLPVLESMVEATPGLVTLRCLLALALSDVGRIEEARIHFDELVAGDLSRIPHDSTWSVSLANLTEVCFVLKDRSAAQPLRRELEAFAGQMLVIAWGVACLGAADGYIALLDSVLGDRHAAEEGFTRATAFEEALPSPPLAERTRRWRDAALGGAR
jgi:class 3 adenylate cyclase/tetratricopeptide (TPR) repeat protein